MKLAIISVAAAGVAAVGLVTAGVASADPDEKFLTNLEVGGFSWADDAAGDELVSLGHGICQELNNGASAADMITQGVEATGWTDTQWGYFIGAATTSFCPEHFDRALEEAKSLGRG
jgi:hypothetical protein